MPLVPAMPDYEVSLEVPSAPSARKAAKLAPARRGEAGGLAAGADYDVLVGLVGFWIRRAQVKVLRSFERHLDKFKVTPTEVAALILMGANDGLSQIALAAALDADQSTVVNLLVSLERRGMISRIRLPQDRRYQVLSLTRAGRESLRGIKLALAQHNRSLQRPLSAQEKKALLALLRRFVEA